MIVYNGINLLLWSMAVGVISVTIAKGGPFKWFKEYLLAHHKSIGQLVACPFCLSHYVSAIVTVYLALTYKLGIIDAIVLWLALIAGAGAVGLVLVTLLYVSKVHSLLIAESRKKAEEEKSRSIWSAIRGEDRFYNDTEKHDYYEQHK